MRSGVTIGTFVAVTFGWSCAGDTGLGASARVGAVAPAFAAPSLETGDSVSLASFRGSPLVLNLWATWCPPCREETPYLQSIYERYRGAGLQMVGVTVDGRRAAETAREFLREVGATYAQLHDPTMHVSDVFQIIGLPATYVIDAEGILRFAANRPVFDGDEAFEGAVEAVLEATP
jgi:peroxiredoxin